VPERQAAGGSTGALAVLLPRDGSAGAQPLQVPSSPAIGATAATPGAAAPAPGSAANGMPAHHLLSLRMVQYSGAGDLTLGGSAEPHARLIIYVDNRPIGRAVATPQGSWQAASADPLAVGRYRLRIDELGDDGKVAARLAAPLDRVEAPSDLGAGRMVIVQPGNNLWRIARWSYGVGPRYTEIYEANRGQLVDPGLIFPQQIVMVPATQ
jgi:nucleoid-associated protein YgaU